MRSLPARAMVLFCALAPCATFAQQPGQRDYVDGLGLLMDAKWADAERTLAKALDADEENPDIYIARGVARLLGEKAKEAESDFRRAMKLDPRNEEARMWVACAVTMRGDLMRQSDDAPFAKSGDEYFNTIRMATLDYGRGTFNLTRPTDEANVGPEDVAEWRREGTELQAKARPRFPELARMYVEKVERSSPELAGLLRERATKALTAGDPAAAARAFERIRQSDPDDPRSLFDHASAALAAGAPAVAHRELTLFLIAEPRRVDAYLLRARAAALMGAARRARQDMENARSFDPAAADKSAAEIERLIKEHAASLPPSDWPKAVDELRELAKTTPVQFLIAPATKLVRAVNNERLIADEAYQDRLLSLLRQVWKNENDASARAALGDFLYRNAIDPRGESVGPRDEFTTYRTLTDKSRERELDAAIASADEGLKRDPNHVHCTAVKAAVLVQRRQWADAERLLRRALEVKADDPRVLLLMAQVLDHAAAVRAAEAADLRSVKQWEDMVYIYTRRPSRAELAEADRLDTQAERLWQMARAQLERAASSRKGSAEGYYFQAMLARRDGDKQATVRALEEAVRLDPANLEYRDFLGTACADAGDRERAFKEKFAAANLVQTTAGPLLRLAWSNIPQTRFATARKLLDGAIATDPADPRGPAYMAVVAEARDDPESNLAWTRVAQTIHLAATAFEGPTAAVPAKANDVALAVALGVRAGDVLLKQSQPDEALAAYASAIQQFNRVASMDRWPRVPRAMLPDAGIDQFTIPEALPLVVHGGWAHVGRGKSLAALGRLDDAQRDFQTAESFLTNRPPTIDAGSSLEPMACAARLELVDLSLKRGRPQEARQRIQQFVRQGGVWPAMKDRYEDLLRQVEAAAPSADPTDTFEAQSRLRIRR